MFLIGPISLVFDYVTFFIMLWVFQKKDHKPALFQTGWFVESLLTQILIIHIIRTAKVPLLESRASWAVIAAIGIILPLLGSKARWAFPLWHHYTGDCCA